MKGDVGDLFVGKPPILDAVRVLVDEWHREVAQSRGLWEPPHRRLTKVCGARLVRCGRVFNVLVHLLIIRVPIAAFNAMKDLIW